MRRIFLFGLLFLSYLPLHALAQDNDTENFGIMRPDINTIIQWQNESRKAPRAYIDQNIRRKLQYYQEMNFGTSMSIGSKLTYVPAERQQTTCGNCWNWAGQGVAGIALNVQESISDRLSTQYLNSCKIDKYACCGGWLTQFADWYNQKGMFVSWNNSGASFIDGQTSCDSGSSSQQCADIATTFNHPINSIAAVTVTTTGVNQAGAIDNIKNVLNQNKAIWFGFFLPTQAAWNAFKSFWGNQGEEAVFAMDGYCGTTWDNHGGGGHAVLLVGYNDDVAEPYWEFINSWGTANNKRPNGIFRIKMNMNYGCTYPVNGTPIDAFTFQTLNIVFANSHPQCSYAISPPSATFTAGGGDGAIDVITSSTCAWTATTTDSWIVIISGSSGTGNGTVSYRVATNTSIERTGTITVGGKQFAISQQAVSTSGQLLKNPGFEEGNNGEWAEDSIYEMIYEYPCYTFTGLDCSQEGTHLAWLGGYDYADDRLYQDIVLPANLVSASLRFWYGIESYDSLLYSYDYLEVKIIRIRDNYSKTLVILDNTQAADEWVHSDSFNISEFIGESIRLQFYGITDSADITNFYIDNIQLSGIGKIGIGKIFHWDMFLPAIIHKKNHPFGGTGRDGLKKQLNPRIRTTTFMKRDKGKVK